MTDSVRIRARSVMQDFVETVDTRPEELHVDPAVSNDDDSPMSPKAMQAKKDQEILSKAAAQRCLVYCRLRPTKKGELNDEDGTFMLLQLQKKIVKVKDDKTYEFDGTYGGDSKQEDVFSGVAKPCLDNALHGFRSALMCYGQTGTGKSFTMCNTKVGDEGIIPRSARYIFDQIDADSSRSYEVKAQFIQIYRDQLGDLMTESGQDKVDIRCEAEEGVTLPGCSEHILKSRQDFMNVYDEGNKRRVVTATAMNPESSRGHTALVIWIASKPKNDECGAQLRGKVTFIDLAGYERFSKTGISNSNPIQKDEAKTINASLLSLGHVVSALSANDKHIPWRNAKLTRLLQDSIGGKSRTTIILTVGPSSDHLHETTNTLQFGQRAMAVKVEAKITTHIDFEKLAQKLQSMLDEKEEKINVLELQLTAKQTEREGLEAMMRRDLETMRIRHRSELEKLLAEGAAAERVQALLAQNEVEEEILTSQHTEALEYHEETYNRDTLALVDEMSNQQKLVTSDIKVRAQEEIIELRRRLASLTSGEEGEMVMNELNKKDEIISQRSAEISVLRETIETLQNQVVSLGGDVIPIPPLPSVSTSVDAAFVADMQTRFDKEIEVKSQIAAELQRQVDVLTETLQGRADEIQHLQEQLEISLQSNGTKEEDLSATMNAMNMSITKIPKLNLVDGAAAQAEKLRLQGEIDARDNLIQTLKEAMASRPRSGTYVPVAAAPEPSGVQKEVEKFKSLALEKEVALQESIALVNKLKSQIETSGGVADVSSQAQDGSGLRHLMEAKEETIQILERTLQQRDEILGSRQAEVKHLETLIQDLRSKIPEGSQGITIIPSTSSNLVDKRLVESHIITADELRGQVRKLQKALYDTTVEKGAANANESLQLDLVKQRDLQIGELQAQNFQLANQISSMFEIVHALEDQLKGAGQQPNLSQEHQEIMKAEILHVEESLHQRQQREEIEQRLRAQEAETEKVKQIIKNLSEQRKKDLSRMKQLEEEKSELEKEIVSSPKMDAMKTLEQKMAQYQAQVEDLEGRTELDDVMREKLQAELRRIQEQKKLAELDYEQEKEKLKKEIEQSTRDLMAAQAAAAAMTQPEEDSFLSKLKTKFFNKKK